MVWRKGQSPGGSLSASSPIPTVGDLKASDKEHQVGGGWDLASHSFSMAVKQSSETW